MTLRFYDLTIFQIYGFTISKFYEIFFCRADRIFCSVHWSPTFGEDGVVVWNVLFKGERVRAEVNFTIGSFTRSIFPFDFDEETF